MTEFNKNNPLTGRRLGNYKIESLIAEGGMSSVYEGVHMLLGRRVAVKQLNPLLEQKDGIKERLKNEAVTLSKLKHPHIVTIYDYIECELGTFIIEELIKGIPNCMSDASQECLRVEILKILLFMRKFYMLTFSKSQ